MRPWRWLHVQTGTEQRLTWRRSSTMQQAKSRSVSLSANVPNLGFLLQTVYLAGSHTSTWRIGDDTPVVCHPEAVQCPVFPSSERTPNRLLTKADGPAVQGPPTLQALLVDAPVRVDCLSSIRPNRRQAFLILPARHNVPQQQGPWEFLFLISWSNRHTALCGASDVDKGY